MLLSLLLQSNLANGQPGWRESFELQIKLDFIEFPDDLDSANDNDRARYTDSLITFYFIDNSTINTEECLLTCRQKVFKIDTNYLALLNLVSHQIFVNDTLCNCGKRKNVGQDSISLLSPNFDRHFGILVINYKGIQKIFVLENFLNSRFYLGDINFSKTMEYISIPENIEKTLLEKNEDGFINLQKYRL